MKIADLIARKNQKVEVRVPAAAQKEYGLRPEVKGKVVRVERHGRLARVTVEVRGKEYVFRPQDLSVA